MPTQMFLCNKCGYAYETSDAAADCEDMHPLTVEIIGFHYESGRGKYPSEITILFADKTVHAYQYGFAVCKKSKYDQ